MNAWRRLTWIFCLPILVVISCQGTVFEPEVTPTERDLFHTPSFRQPAAPSVELLADAPQGITLKVDAGSIRIGAQRSHERMFSTLDCAACGWTQELGKPRLPVIRRFVEIPAGASVSVQVEAVERKVVSLEELGAGHLVFPVQRPVEKLPGAKERTPFEMDEELYTTDALYPPSEVDVSEPLVIRGHWLVLVEVHPFRYNPLRAEIHATETTTLRLSFEGGAAAVSTRRFSPAFDAWFAAHVVNHRPRVLTRDISTDRYAEGILFVVGNAYASDADLLNYIDARRAEGHMVQMVPMSDIGTTDGQLRAYVRGEYLSWTGPSLSYVVLVGDVDDVPTHDGSGGGNDQATDLYYASIDPDNYTSDLLAPDLMVSRISVNNANELGTYLARAGSYIYADFPADMSWMRKWSWLASCDNSNISEGTHNYVIANYTEPAGFTGTYPSDPQVGGDQLYCAAGGLTESVIQAALDDGRVVINFSGHGGETMWADPSFTQTYLNGVQPPDAAPFVISNACVTGTIDYFGGDCWGEMWLAHAQGAIIFWGASNNSYWDEDDILERRMWDGVFQDGITRFADLIRNAKLATLAHYGANGTMEYYFEMYNVLGDSTMDLYTDVPYDATVIYPSAVPVGVDQIDFSVTNGAVAVEGALVCARGGVVQQVGYTDASGSVTLVLNPPPDTLGDLQVTVTAHNMRRHEGTIQVISAQGPYLVHTDHEVTSDGATPVAPTPGRSIVLPITVRNIGNQTAVGASGVLSSTSSDVTITQNQVTFPDIAADAQGRSTAHAEFDIHADAADGSVAAFQLDWTAQGGAAGTARFSVTVGRPNLVYLSHTVDDATGNCDQDDIADSSEPTQFDVTIENLGSADANQVSVVLSAPDCVVDGPAAVGAVPAGGQATASFIVTPQTSVACPAEDVGFTVSASAAELPAPDTSGFVEMLNADIASGSYADDMEGTEPNGWSHEAAAGVDDWAYVTTDSHSATRSWFSADVDDIKDARLMTPPITIGDTALLTFWHRFDFEDGYDGGVIEISTDGGGSYSDLGAFIIMNGYNDTLSDWSSNPLAGRQAWSSTQAWQQVDVDLSSFGPADVIIRFRLGCDGSVEATGWWIDDFQLDAETIVCQVNNCGAPNNPPVADAGPDQAVTEDDTVTLDGSASYDPDDNPISYQWSQTAGPPVTLSDDQAVSPTFTPPDVAAPTLLAFQLVVSDWQHDSAPVSVDITINPVNHPPVADAGADQQVDEFDIVTLDGSVSHDPDDDTIGYAWSQTAGPQVALSDPQAIGPTFTAPDVQGLVDLVFELTVTDAEFGSSDSVTVSVWGECDDGLACTDDSWNGTACEYNPVDCDDGSPCTVDSCSEPDGCQHEVLPDCSLCGADGVCMGGTCIAGAQGNDEACDDGDACTQADVCRGGACVGTDPVVCEALDTCHVAGVCDPDTGVCSDPPAEDGTACDDGDACTQADTCQAGACLGADPVVCEPLDTCHEAGECDPDTGECSNPVLADGTSCDDGNGCTQTDTCDAGVCVGADPVVCEASDACHVAGECDPDTGACSDPPAEDGIECDDGSACTRSDTCQDGTCVGADPVVCEASDVCHEVGECDPASGTCSDPLSPDGKECPEGECEDGVCVESAGCGCVSASTRASGPLLSLLLLALIAGTSRRRRGQR